MKRIAINQSKLEKSSDMLRAIAHPLRLKILNFIHRNDSVNVNKIYNTLKLEQSITSQHLKILRDADLVYTDRDGKFIYYNLNYQELKNIVECLGSFLSNNGNGKESY